ncbi:hypothetical protein K1T71_003897 [Dendrolimus kikuchii]|uniref:Uncharacterized protein n=1 Tax=Dendrolimus kikuchii TaxID=765133 RepID=A0ACC1DA82_9NEOP|nr:hypothetical protein K1T71_003897 [Dendrolimus kikuchii]
MVSTSRVSSPSRTLQSCTRRAIAGLANVMSTMDPPRIRTHVCTVPRFRIARPFWIVQSSSSFPRALVAGEPQAVDLALKSPAINTGRGRLIEKKMGEAKRHKSQRRVNTHPEDDSTSIANNMEEPGTSIPPAEALKTIP